jgi:molybdenum cofactor cytidylyltransferase
MPIVVLSAPRLTQSATPKEPLPRLSVVNPHPERGKTSSILTGLQNLPLDWEAIAITAVDQPRPAELYALLLNAFWQHAAPITDPQYQNRLGHPLIFSRETRSQLLAIQEETLGLGQVMQQFRDRLHAVECSDTIVHADLNTLDLYRD